MSKQIMGTSARLCAAVVAATLVSCGGGGGAGDSGESGVSPGLLAAAIPEGDHILFAVTGLLVTEFDNTASISIVRTGDALGDTTVNYRVNDGSAKNGADFLAADGVLSWADGETGEKQIAFDLYPDISTETLENFEVELFELSGEETISGSSTINVDIADEACLQVSGELQSNTNWAGPCYHITDSVIVSEQAQLTIERGATVIANASAGITISDNATIHVDGSQQRPVRFKGASSAVGSWSGIAITSTNPLQQLNHVVIEGASIGLDLVPGAQLGSFANNTINNTTIAAIRIPTDVIDSLGDALVFNNNPGGIQLLTEIVTSDNPLTLTPQTTHYSSGQSLIVDGKLVLEAGVDLRFGADARMYIGQNGSLNAAGTEAAPILISGVNPIAGFWNGIQWVSSVSGDNRLSYVTVEYGGGDPVRPGNLIIEGSGTVLVIENSTLANSRGYGLYQKGAGSNITQDNVTYSNNELGEHVIQ